jgi:glycosyltransferase involved in cell wall biosynthesis
MSGPQGHLLLVTVASEPLAHVSPTRPTHMARELSALGWDVTLLSVDWSQPPRPVPAPVAECVAAALARPSPRLVALDGRLSNPAFDPGAMPPGLEPVPASALLRRLATLRNTLSGGPYRSWARHAVAAAELVHAGRPIDVVWAIHGDDSSHEVAHRLRLRLGIPWVADFKDPWNTFHSRLARPLQRLATARRLASAAAITETCLAQASADEREFSRATEVVYSGYDPGLMAQATPERPGEEFALVYLGNVGAPHDARLVAPLFAELRRRGSLASTGITLHQFGQPTRPLRSLLESVGCADAARDHDRVPRSRAFGLMRGADVLLLLPLTAGPGTFVGVKELEYFASGTPVLALGGLVDEFAPLARACPQVRVARSAGEAADFLEAEARAVAHGGSGSRVAPNPPALAEFTWPAQAARLAAVLCAARSAGGARRPSAESDDAQRAAGERRLASPG